MKIVKPLFKDRDKWIFYDKPLGLNVYFHAKNLLTEKLGWFGGSYCMYDAMED